MLTKFFQASIAAVLLSSLLIVTSCQKDDNLFNPELSVPQQQPELAPSQHSHGEVELYAPEAAQAATREMMVRLPFREKPVKVKVQLIDGLVIFEGDIILGTEEDMQKVTSRSLARVDGRWPGGIIPYVIASGHPREAEILQAIQHVNSETRLRLIPRTTQRDYVDFQLGTGCGSFIGQTGGRQPITISTACRFGNIVHEICHAAGLYHEQSRCDRDQYVQIHPENIIAEKLDNFDRICTDAVDIGDYDYGSIMHYHAFAFSKNDRPTITVRTPPGTSTTVIGQRSALSSGDISAINRLYPNDTPLRAWVWANSPTSSSYTPNTSYSHNSGSTSAITIRRSARGTYQVTIPEANGDFGGIAHAVAYGGNHSAQVRSWYTSGNNLLINVKVFDPAGNAKDGRFVLFYYRETRTNSRINSAYQWANSTTNLSNTYSFNATGEANELSKISEGRYQVVFNGIDENSNGKLGTVIATPYGAQPLRVQVAGWSHSGDQVTATILVSDVNGSARDGMFTVSYISDFGIGQNNYSEDLDYGAYVWANNPFAGSYTPHTSYQDVNTSGSPVTIQRLGTGYYKVVLPNIRGFNSTMAIASVYGYSRNYVSIQGWVPNDSGGTDVYVRCYRPSGIAVDDYFTLFYYTNENILF